MTTKQKLHNTCLIHLEERITDLKSRIASIVESRNNETKSSAGDKYETSRAMMQMEEDKVVAQLELAQQMQSRLRQLNTLATDETIRLGSLVKTSLRNYYLSIGLGKIVLDKENYYCISTDSPIGKLLLGKKRGDTIAFNGVKDEIKELH
jgi:transcription elongation GreA/GreB family factor